MAGTWAGSVDTPAELLRGGHGGPSDSRMSDEIIPDDKDWTWVLERPCPECGFVASEFEPTSVGELAPQNAAAWAELLGGDRGRPRRRPVVDRWSDLEYSAHVRDVFRLYLDSSRD